MGLAAVLEEVLLATALTDRPVVVVQMALVVMVPRLSFLCQPVLAVVLAPAVVA